MKFEGALEQLENLVAEMETGNLALEDSMKKFELGMKLSEFCQKRLDEAEKKIEILVKKSSLDEEWTEFQ